MGLLERFHDAQLAPYLTLQTLLTLERVSAGDGELVAPALQGVAEVAESKGLAALVEGGAPQELSAAVLRFHRAAGVDVEGLPMPRLVSAVYNWAHYGRRGDSRRPLKRSAHLAALLREFPPLPGQAERGIVATMQMELRAVEVVVKLKLALGGSLAEVAELPLVPEDLRGVTPGRATVQCIRGRPALEATALMWATKQGTRWVKAMLRLGADARQVTADGSALLYAAVFESRGAVLDGATDSGEQYGGYRENRPRGCVGPLLDAGASLNARIPARRFLDLFGPSPVAGELIGPVEVCIAESSPQYAWAQEIARANGLTLWG